MEPNQLFFGVALVMLLFALAAYFAWRQLLALRSLRTNGDLSPDDQRYVRHQAWRRLVCSGLMVLLAGMLAVSFYLEEPTSQALRQNAEARARGEEPTVNPEQRQFFALYRNYWGITLLVLLAIIVTAAWDFFAIRRYGQSQYRKIQAERRAMIEGELTRLRSQRNGHD